MEERRRLNSRRGKGIGTKGKMRGFIYMEERKGETPKGKKKGKVQREGSKGNILRD